MQHTYDSRSALARVDELRGGEMRNARDVPRLRLDVVQPQASAALKWREATRNVHLVREEEQRHVAAALAQRVGSALAGPAEST